MLIDFEMLINLVMLIELVVLIDLVMLIDVHFKQCPLFFFVFYAFIP